MDERKWSLRRVLKYSILSALGLSTLLAAYGLVVYLQTKTIDDPKKCFTTSMYKVRLCPGSENYVYYKAVPQHFFQALILSEDASFYSHKGFDWFEIKESFRRNFTEWKFSRGGSTLTQQLAKNLYLSKDKTLTRKFKEFFISKQIEERLSKWQILEKYVNVVEFGKNIYGLKKASLHYFGKPPEYLNPLESIYLVSLLPSPKRLSKSYDERKLSKKNLWRMNIILKRLYRFKKIPDNLYIYIQMLLEEYPWPFDYYSEEGFDSESIEEQMMLEFDEMEADDEEEAFPESEKKEPEANDSQQDEEENLEPEEEKEETLEPETSEEPVEKGETQEETNDESSEEEETQAEDFP